MVTFETISEIISLARRSGLESVADRLDYLYHLGVDNGDEPINQESVNTLVTFMIEHPKLDTDTITVNPEGFVNAEWDIAANRTLDVQFFPLGNVWFVYAEDDDASGTFKILKRGDSSPNEMFKSIMPLVENST